jgi:uncharacterized DUF497 family protein
VADSRLEFVAPTGFEWDEDKSNANLIKHGIDFEDASEVFFRASNRNSEERWIAIGKSRDRIMAVIFIRRNDSTRIISARHPRPDEERAYRDASMGRSTQGKD